MKTIYITEHVYNDILKSLFSYTLQRRLDNVVTNRGFDKLSDLCSFIVCKKYVIDLSSEGVEWDSYYIVKDDSESWYFRAPRYVREGVRKFVKAFRLTQ